MATGVVATADAACPASFIDMLGPRGLMESSQSPAGALHGLPGLHPPAAALPSAHANAAQHTSQLGGIDVPMLEELLPLTDLHDPFLDAAWDAPPSPHRHQGIGGCPHQCGHPAVPSALFAGIPAYAEPGSPGAALLNNAAHGLALDQHAALAPAPHAHPVLGGLVPASLGSPGLAPAVATAQQHAAAALHSQRAHSDGSSLASDGSALPFPPFVGAALPRSDDSSAAHAKEDALGDGTPTHSTSPAPHPGSAPAPAPQAAKRGGRPREKKPYDSLIDPSLPADEVRRLRRVLSNRESARRSRRRTQSQLSSLEAELEALRTDKARLESELGQAAGAAAQLAADKAALAAEVQQLRGQLARAAA